MTNYVKCAVEVPESSVQLCKVDLYSYSFCQKCTPAYGICPNHLFFSVYSSYRVKNYVMMLQPGKDYYEVWMWSGSLRNVARNHTSIEEAMDAFLKVYPNALYTSQKTLRQMYDKRMGERK